MPHMPGPSVAELALLEAECVGLLRCWAVVGQGGPSTSRAYWLARDTHGVWPIKWLQFILRGFIPWTPVGRVHHTWHRLMELLRAMLLALLLLAAPRPTEAAGVRAPQSGHPTTRQDPELVELNHLESFPTQVGAVTADKRRVASLLFENRSTAQYNPKAWTCLNSLENGRFSNVACSVVAENDKRESRKFLAQFGYALGFKSFIVSSEYINTRAQGKRIVSNIKRATAGDFKSIEAFKRIASGSKSSDAKLGERGWAAGLWHDPQASQVTMISTGPVGLHLILMEEDPHDGRLKPRYLAEPNTRRVIQLRKTPDRSRLRKYYLLVVEEEFLQHAKEFMLPVPQQLGDMKAIIEAGCEKIRRRSPPPILLLINLQEALPEGDEAATMLETQEADDGEQPEQLDRLRSGTIRDYGSIETVRSGGWRFINYADQLFNSAYPGGGAWFDRFSSTNFLLKKTGTSSNMNYGAALQSKTILFSSGLTSNTKAHGESFVRYDEFPDFCTKGNFRRAAKINAKGSAVGVQINQGRGTLTLARFGQPPLVVLVFKETKGGEMELVVRVLESDKLIEMAVEKHPKEDRTCEYWLVFVAPSAVERLEYATDLRAGEMGFDKASDKMFKLISQSYVNEPPCKEQKLFAARLKPRPLAPETVLGSEPSSGTANTVINAKVNPTGRNSRALRSMPTLVAEQPQAPIKSSQVIAQTIQGPQFNKVYYVGRRLKPAASHPSAYRRSSPHSGVYITEDVLVASRSLRNTKKGRKQLRRLIKATPSPTDMGKRQPKGGKVAFRMGLDRTTGNVYVSACGDAPLMLILLWAGETGGLEYRVLSKNNRRRRVRAKYGKPMIYAVVNRQLEPRLKILSKSLKMPSTEEELAELARSLDYRQQGLADNPKPELDWAVHAALFPVNMPWQDATITGDEPTDSDSE